MKVSPLVYLQKNIGSDFFQEWKKMSEDDKQTLRKWAAEEIVAKGGEVEGA